MSGGRRGSKRALAISGDLQTAEAALTAALEDARSRGSALGFATASHMRAMAILLRELYIPTRFVEG